MPGHWPEGNVCTANYCRARRSLVTASQGQHAHFPLRAGLSPPGTGGLVCSAQSCPSSQGSVARQRPGPRQH